MLFSVTVHNEQSPTMSAGQCRFTKSIQRSPTFLVLNNASSTESPQNTHSMCFTSALSITFYQAHEWVTQVQKVRFVFFIVQGQFIPLTAVRYAQLYSLTEYKIHQLACKNECGIKYTVRIMHIHLSKLTPSHIIETFQKPSLSTLSMKTSRHPGKHIQTHRPDPAHRYGDKRGCSHQRETGKINRSLSFRKHFH